MKALLVATVLALAACAAQSSGPTPKATVLALESGLTAAEKAALVYASLPRCAGPVVTACSATATVKTIVDLDSVAYAAVTNAQTAVDADPTASASTTQAFIADATAAVGAFTAATGKLAGS